jgi:ABC-type phosphate transport system substrate-binding protein
VFKYYTTNDADAVSNMVQGFTDFGGLDVELTPDEAASMPDVELVPMVAYAVAPAYSVDVFAYGSLRFDLPTLADIYLGNHHSPM